MERKLRLNDHKGVWDSLGVEGAQWFLDRLRDEVSELEEAMGFGDPMDIAQEAADVGNFAMMIMDIYSKKRC